MNVDYDISDLSNCKIIVSNMNSNQFDELRIILYQLYQYKEGGKAINPFGLKKLIEQMSK